MSTKVIEWLDGKPRRITFDLQAQMDAEAYLGMGLQKAQFDLPGPRLFVVLLFYGLARNDSSLSLRKVTEMTQDALENKRITGLELQNLVMGMIADSVVFSGFGREPAEDSEASAVPLLESSTED